MYELRKTLTVQIHLADSGWVDCATLELKNPELGPADRVTGRYINSFITEGQRINHLGAIGIPAVWMQMPLEYAMSLDFDHWPVFLMDIIPTGAAQRYWKSFLMLENNPENIVAAHMLQRGAIAPIGNVRIREAFESGSFIHRKPMEHFSWENAASRMDDFVTHATRHGMMISGGTGAGGDAPKILLRMDANKKTVWVDPYPDIRNKDAFYLVKFPRRQDGNARPTDRDKDILRTEFIFYHELAAMGIDTIDVKNIYLLEDGQHDPTLWLPRFDREYDHQKEQWRLLGVESVNAAVAGNASNKHESILMGFKKLFSQNASEFLVSFDDLAAEWVRRDLLNVIFGNSDNHGRNSSVVKSEGGIKLAPVYDFAPMAADESSIHRTIRWGDAIEKAAVINWHLLPGYLEKMRLGSADLITVKLLDTMRKSKGLYDRLIERGAPESILNLPRINMKSLDEKIAQWIFDLNGRDEAYLKPDFYSR
ncbi:MAG: HipA domain-containing protein [Marinospirillum sp.]|uniref:HipA domain-containing protein n=1 Tax=Marinospirillum sp. TaxID=2183934 RepID=UPI001A0A0E89|nr:HipA domain-containing protein [Marinospirillum sp.]MBE0508017.1 HipA domain-containing protein [Marinospirillum sp.]